jgi:hypothetical protein
VILGWLRRRRLGDLSGGWKGGKQSSFARWETSIRTVLLMFWARGTGIGGSNAIVVGRVLQQRYILPLTASSYLTSPCSSSDNIHPNLRHGHLSPNPSCCTPQPMGPEWLPFTVSISSQSTPTQWPKLPIFFFLPLPLLKAPNNSMFLLADMT